MVQSDVNTNSLLSNGALNASFTYPFWTCKINQVKSTNGPNIASLGLGFNLHDKNTVRTRWSIVTRSLCHHLKFNNTEQCIKIILNYHYSICISNKQKVQSILLVLGFVNTQTLQKYLFALILERPYFRQILELLGAVICI